MDILNPKQFYLDILKTLEVASKDQSNVFLGMTLILVLCAVIYSFFGYRIYKWILRLVGFSVGVWMALYLSKLFHLPSASNRMYLEVILSAIFGLTGSLFAPRLFHLITFALGGLGVLLVLGPIFPLIQEPYGWLAMLVSFAAGGFLSFLLVHVTLVISTSIMGSYMLSAFIFSIAVHFHWVNNNFNFFIFYATWFVLGVFSMTSQFKQKRSSNIDQFS